MHETIGEKFLSFALSLITIFGAYGLYASFNEAAGKRIGISLDEEGIKNAKNGKASEDSFCKDVVNASKYINKAQQISSKENKHYKLDFEGCKAIVKSKPPEM